MRLLPVPDAWLSYSVLRRLLDRDLELVRGAMKGRVLEIGNGHAPRRGRFKPPVAEVDSWTFLDLSTERLPDVQADLHALPFGSACFDTAVCLEVLEYVTDPKACLRELARVLKPGAALILSTPFHHRRDHAKDLWRWTDEGLKQLVGKSGFVIEQIFPQGGELAVLASLLFRKLQTMHPSLRRNLLSALAKPFLFCLLKRDEKHSSHDVVSTGYLLLALRENPT